MRHAMLLFKSANAFDDFEASLHNIIYLLHYARRHRLLIL